MSYKKLTALLLSALISAGAAGCSNGVNISIDSAPAASSSAETPVSTGVDGIGELITPAEDSEEADLGSYRMSPDGVKLYYDDDVPPEVMLALERYFKTFQNKDFEGYKECMHPDYLERYDKFLNEEYQYGLETSFENNCSGLRSRMVTEITGIQDAADSGEYTGDFKITRIRAVKSVPEEGETEDDIYSHFFSYLDEAFGMDYGEQMKKDADSMIPLTFYIIAEGDDTKEHLLIGDYEIVFAEKDGKYYTFG